MGSSILNLNITKDTFLNLILYPSHKDLSEIVITGSSRAIEIKKNPASIATLSSQNLLEQNNSNLIDALKNIPGIQQVTTGSAISKPIIRGLGYNRIITLYDGIRQEGQQWGDEHGIEIGEGAISKVEIIKGPASLIYGSDAIAGVIQFISPHTLHENEKMSSVITSYQSNQKMWSYTLSHLSNKNGIEWRWIQSQKMASNFQNQLDGKVLNSGLKEFDINTALNLRKKWGNIKNQLSYYKTLIALPEGERNDDGKFIFENKDGQWQEASAKELGSYKIGIPNQNISHIRFINSGLFYLKKSNLSYDVAFQNNLRKEFGEIQEPEQASIFLNLKTLNYNLKYSFNSKQPFHHSIGLNGMLQANKNGGLEFLVPNYQLFDAGIFYYGIKEINKKISISGGLRSDIRSIQGQSLWLDTNGHISNAMDINATEKFKDTKNQFSGFSASIGIASQLNENTTIKLNFAQGYRAPNIAEIASNGKHEGSFRYEIGNPSLQSEISRQIDLTYNFNNEHLQIDISPFANYVSNFIYTEKLLNNSGKDSVLTPNDPAPVFLYSQKNAKLLGSEIFIHYHPHPLDWLHFENAFSYVNGQFKNHTDSTKFLSMMPPAKNRVVIKASWSNISTNINQCYILINNDYYFAQNKIYSAYNTELPSKAYNVWNFGTGIELSIKKLQKTLGIYLSVDNILNTSYQSHLNRLRYAPINNATGNLGIFNMGRNVGIKIKYGQQS